MKEIMNILDPLKNILNVSKLFYKCEEATYITDTFEHRGRLKLY